MSDVRLSKDSKKSAPAKDFPTPVRDEVVSFHQNSDLDEHQSAQHHTLGAGTNQAAPGDHTHDGGSSSPLWAGGETLAGVRGSAAYYSALEALLQSKGVKITATGP